MRLTIPFYRGGLSLTSHKPFKPTWRRVWGSVDTGLAPPVLRPRYLQGQTWGNGLELALHCPKFLGIQWPGKELSSVSAT